MMQLNFDDLNYYRKAIRQAEGLPDAAKEAEQARRALQDASRVGSGRHMEQLLENVRRPIIAAATRDLLSFRDVIKQLKPISQFRLPTAVYSPRIDLGENAAKAAFEAAQSAQAAQLKRVAEEVVNSFRVRVPAEALASAQYAAVRSMLQDPPWQRTVAQLARAPMANAQKQYAETLRRATRLLSDETVRRMAELAESVQMLEQGAVAAEETDALFEGMVTAEDVEPVALDPNSAIDTLLPFVRWTILILSIAAITAASDPNYAEYKEPIYDALGRLAILERALDLCRKRDEDNSTR
jgi:hypothetical protein